MGYADDERRRRAEDDAKHRRERYEDQRRQADNEARRRRERYEDQRRAEDHRREDRKREDAHRREDRQREDARLRDEQRRDDERRREQRAPSEQRAKGARQHYDRTDIDPKHRDKGGPGLFSLLVVVGIVYAVWKFFSGASSPSAVAPSNDSAPSAAVGNQSTLSAHPRGAADSEVAPSHLAPVENHDVHPAVAQSQMDTPQALPPASASTRADSRPASSATPSDHIFTDAEIDQMEEEKQYHGDDPIVRARLGLPSRETKRLISSK